MVVLVPLFGSLSSKPTMPHHHSCFRWNPIPRKVGRDWTLVNDLLAIMVVRNAGAIGTALLAGCGENCRQSVTPFGIIGVRNQQNRISNTYLHLRLSRYGFINKQSALF